LKLGVFTPTKPSTAKANIRRIDLTLFSLGNAATPPASLYWALRAGMSDLTAVLIFGERLGHQYCEQPRVVLVVDQFRAVNKIIFHASADADTLFSPAAT
jgi:hypothetical protein